MSFFDTHHKQTIFLLLAKLFCDFGFHMIEKNIQMSYASMSDLECPMSDLECHHIIRVFWILKNLHEYRLHGILQIYMIEKFK